MKMGKVEKSLNETYITRRKLNPNKEDNEKRKRKDSIRRVSLILKKCEAQRTPEENGLLESYGEVVRQISKRKERVQLYKDRVIEKEDAIEVIERKAEKLAEIISRAKHLVCYTGAGISTSARIPDYRGSKGIWTLLQQGKDIGQHDLSLADPTFTHMALYELHRRKMLRYVVSQNCDGLHLRAGLPKGSLSEVHGNMYIEVCKYCKPNVEYWRLFDTTELTARYYHKTNRQCHLCGKPLIDTIVHFGERGNLKWPLNWTSASNHAEKADVILCIGSSLKVLKKYTWLWQMDKSQKKRAKICIVNLQWTPKDRLSTIKINGKCDEIMRLVMKNLNINVPPYERKHDPIFAHASLLCLEELHTVSQPMLRKDKLEKNETKSDDINPLTNHKIILNENINFKNKINLCCRSQKLPPLLPIKKRSYIKTNINSRHLIVNENYETSTSSYSESDSDENSTKSSDQFDSLNANSDENSINLTNNDTSSISNDTNSISTTNGKIIEKSSSNISKDQILITSSTDKIKFKSYLSKSYEDLTILSKSNIQRNLTFPKRTMSIDRFCNKFLNNNNNNNNNNNSCDIVKKSLNENLFNNHTNINLFSRFQNWKSDENTNSSNTGEKSLISKKDFVKNENKRKDIDLKNNEINTIQSSTPDNSILANYKSPKIEPFEFDFKSLSNNQIIEKENLKENSENDIEKMSNFKICNQIQIKTICDTNKTLASNILNKTINNSLQEFDKNINLLTNALRIFRSQEFQNNPNGCQLLKNGDGIPTPDMQHHFFGISSIEMKHLANSNENYKNFLKYFQAVNDKMPYWYEVDYAYSGLHSIIQPPPPEINLWSSISVPIYEMNRKDAECEFCFDNYAEYKCQFYRKYNTEFFMKKYRNNVLIVCECCDYSDNEFPNTNSLNGIIKKGDKRVKLDLSSSSSSQQQAVATKIQAGWYGKGYRKYRKKKK